MGHATVGPSGLRVAVVGSGPAGLYAAVDLLQRDADAYVEMFERLPVPGGLARFGVAPDHAARRRVVDHYSRLAIASGRFVLHANVEVGRHVGHDELLAHFHAVIHARGASGDRRLGIPGEDLPGSHAATEFVAWYNGHPDHAGRHFDLDTERVIVVGNGNVALDLARMLLMPAERLVRTDVADRARSALAGSRIREVMILGRRGPAQAAFSVPELLEVAGLDDVETVVDCPAALLEDGGAGAHPMRLQLLRELAQRTRPAGSTRRLVLRFLASPVEILGSGRAESVRVMRNRLVRDGDGSVRAEATGAIEVLPAGLVLRSVGYRAWPVPGLPFDHDKAVVPSLRGRVYYPATGDVQAGMYVTGWIKRGPHGVIGTNKVCAQETVSALLEDAAAGVLSRPLRPPQELASLVAQRQPAQVGYGDWKRAERDHRRWAAQ